MQVRRSKGISSERVAFVSRTAKASVVACKILKLNDFSCFLFVCLELIEELVRATHLTPKAF